jgi:Big-like domain-containing protein/WD40 repeat protein
MTLSRALAEELVPARACLQLLHTTRYGLWALPGVLVAVVACGGEPAAPNPVPNPVASVSIEPSSDTMILPLTVQLSAVLRDSLGAPLGGYAVTWASSNSNVAVVSGAGLVTSLGLGVDTIIATAAGKRGVAVLTVAPLITVTPRLPSMFAGDTVQLVARVTDAAGAPLDVGPLSWTSDAPAVAGVSNSGIVTGAASGQATISASSQTGRGSVAVAVLVPTTRPNREIAFLTEGTADFTSELHTIQPDGSGESLVSIPGEFTREFDWSPDGGRLAIVYVPFNGVGNAGLYFSNADGSGSVRVFDEAFAPRWSPDGTRIAFSWCAASGNCDIYSIDATGAGTRRLTTNLSDEQSPQWSPDGRRIAYNQVDSVGSTLWVMDADGTYQQQLLLPTTARHPTWSPDGKMLAVDNGAGVWLVNADGSSPRPLTANCAADGTCDVSVRFVAPDWSFDGQKIAYQATVTFGNATVVVSSVSGNVLAQGGNAMCCAVSPVPQWSPDGVKIAYFGTQPTPPPWPGVAVMNGDATGSQFITGPQNALELAGAQNPGGGKRWRP